MMFNLMFHVTPSTGRENAALDLYPERAVEKKQILVGRGSFEGLSEKAQDKIESCVLFEFFNIVNPGIICRFGKLADRAQPN